MGGVRILRYGRVVSSDKWDRLLRKFIKIICATYLTIFSIGFILPTHIRENAISVYDAFSNAENVPIDLWAYLIVTLSLILWFGIKTLYNYFNKRKYQKVLE